MATPVIATDRATRRRLKKFLGMTFTPSVQFARDYQQKMLEEAAAREAAEPVKVRVKRRAFEDDELPRS